MATTIDLSRDKRWIAQVGGSVVDLYQQKFWGCEIELIMGDRKRSKLTLKIPDEPQIRPGPELDHGLAGFYDGCIRDVEIIPTCVPSEVRDEMMGLGKFIVGPLTIGIGTALIVQHRWEGTWFFPPVVMIKVNGEPLDVPGPHRID